MKAKPRDGYRSELEAKFAKATAKTKDFDYEPYDIPYMTYRHYRPDFVDKRTGIMIECKGFFREGDVMKYKAIRDTGGKELVFLLSSEYTKVRKGAKMNMGQWCDKEGLPWFTLQTMTELLEYLKGRPDHE